MLSILAWTPDRFGMRCDHRFLRKNEVGKSASQLPVMPPTRG